ncbi:hypothetical protein [Actinomadura sp. NPDC000600]|uniref:hypothetical protein n=1 Tax=Actinomadura sp. NPDC000600 TaxID=3154262 RepID=UPI00339B0AE3
MRDGVRLMAAGMFAEIAGYQGRTAQARAYEDRGHSAPFDHGWRELADDTLAWFDGPAWAQRDRR